jgi:hypothetical protein
MKKIITLILAAGLFTTAAFAQDRRHNDNNRNNSYQNQYPSGNGFRSYGNNSNRAGYNDRFGYNRHDRGRDSRWMKRHHRYVKNYRNRSGVAFQITIGGHRNY